MKQLRYPLLIALIATLCACGVKRNLTLPPEKKAAIEAEQKAEKAAEAAKEHKPEAQVEENK